MTRPCVAVSGHVPRVSGGDLLGAGECFGVRAGLSCVCLLCAAVSEVHFDQLRCGPVVFKGLHNGKFFCGLIRQNQ